MRKYQSFLSPRSLISLSPSQKLFHHTPSLSFLCHPLSLVIVANSPSPISEALSHQSSLFSLIPSLLLSLPIHPHPSPNSLSPITEGLLDQASLLSPPPLSITLSSLQTEILKGFWVWVKIKIKISLCLCLCFFSLSLSLSLSLQAWC